MCIRDRDDFSKAIREYKDDECDVENANLSTESINYLYSHYRHHYVDNYNEQTPMLINLWYKEYTREELLYNFFVYFYKCNRKKMNNESLANKLSKSLELCAVVKPDTFLIKR